MPVKYKLGSKVRHLTGDYFIDPFEYICYNLYLNSLSMIEHESSSKIFLIFLEIIEEMHR